MFGLSFWEIAIILVVALIILGPTKLPELARTLGRGIREFRRATEDFKAQVDHEMEEVDEPPAAALPQRSVGSVAATGTPAIPAPETEADVVPVEATPANATPANAAPAEASSPDDAAEEAVEGVVAAEEAREALERAKLEEKEVDA